MVKKSFLYRWKTSLYRLSYRLFSHKKHRIAKIGAAEFVLWPENYIERRIWVEGSYEKQQLNFIAQQVKSASQPFDAFIDIGANFGLYSCILGQTGLFKDVHAFECDPQNIYRLYGHVAMNNLTDLVHVFPFALGDEEKDVFLEQAPKTNSGRSKVSESKENTISIQQKRLDDVLNYQKAQLLLKIDVEGHEMSVLKGAENTLKNNQCLMQIECLEGDQNVMDFLERLNFKRLSNIGNDVYFSNY